MGEIIQVKQTKTGVNTARSWAAAHLDSPVDKVVSLVVALILIPLCLFGIFGGAFVSNNIGAIFCTIAGILVLLVYEIWHQNRQIQTTSVTIKKRLETLAGERSLNIPNDRIAAALEDMLGTSGSWSFRGGSGRWQREAVLPTLSQEKEQKVEYRMLILDPTSDELCSQYASYRDINHHAVAQNNVATVRNDLVACIVACSWYYERTRISPSVFLSQVYSPLRQDISDDTVAITVADPSKDGLFVPKASWYYKPLVDEFEQLCARSKPVTFLKGNNFPKDWREFSDQDVRNALSSARVLVDSQNVPLIELLELDDTAISTIKGLAFKGRTID